MTQMSFAESGRERATLAPPEGRNEVHVCARCGQEINCIYDVEDSNRLVWVNAKPEKQYVLYDVYHNEYEAIPGFVEHRCKREGRNHATPIVVEKKR